jgi:hypothetical protein
LEKPVKSPVFPLNLRQLFQKLKFWNSLDFDRVHLLIISINSLGVAMFFSLGKCFMFPVIRKSTSPLLYNAITIQQCHTFVNGILTKKRPGSSRLVPTLALGQGGKKA